MPELVDTSVWARQFHPRVQPWFQRQLVAGEIAICGPIRLELLHSARNLAEFRAKRQALDFLPDAPIGPREWARATQTYELLAGVGPQHHRPVRHSDLLIAIAAEAAGMTLVHYDHDFDAIQSVTGQPMRWVAPRAAL
jgi:predicted nucleic acid-binding protein